jgi:hypothetical protein
VKSRSEDLPHPKAAARTGILDAENRLIGFLKKRNLQLFFEEARPRPVETRAIPQIREKRRLSPARWQSRLFEGIVPLIRPVVIPPHCGENKTSMTQNQ